MILFNSDEDYPSNEELEFEERLYDYLESFNEMELIERYDLPIEEWTTKENFNKVKMVQFIVDNDLALDMHSVYMFLHVKQANTIFYFK